MPIKLRRLATYGGVPARSMIGLGKRVSDARTRRAATRLYAGFIGPDDLVFDVGANIGQRTASFRALGADVVAIEPQRSCLDRLEERYGGDPKVHIVAAGVARAPGTMQLNICDRAPTISTMSEAWRDKGRFAGDHEWNRSETVAVTTLDALIDEYGLPVFCKIDVEGFELDVLSGLSRPVRQISFEFCREFADQTAACIRRIDSLGSYGYNVSFGASMRFLLPHNVPGDELLTQLDRQPDPMLWGDVYATHVGEPSPK